MSPQSSEPLIRAVDAVQIPVPDLDAALVFYRDALGHSLRWRTDTSAGLSLPDSEAELVLTTERDRLEPNLLVDSADEAAREFEARGGSIEVAPFDIPVGRVAVVRDPFGNMLVLIDLSKGRYVSDDDGVVTDVR